MCRRSCDSASHPKDPTAARGRGAGGLAWRGPPRVTVSSWQLGGDRLGQRTRLRSGELSRQGPSIGILAALLTMFAVVVVLVLLAVMPAVRFVKRLTQPVDSLLDTVRRVRDGDLSPPPPAGAQGELKELEDALGNMVAALDEAQAALQQNVDQATQDLREPLETIEIQNI